MTALLKRRTTIGALLITVGLIFVIIGGIWWAHESERVARANANAAPVNDIFNQAANNLGVLPLDAIHASAHRTGEIIVLVAGGGMALFGTLLIVTGTGAARAPESADPVRE